MSDERSYGYEVIDPGHRYSLDALDGDIDQELQFVKRTDGDDPTRFPWNDTEYPGVTCQFVLRALADRVRYLDGQKECPENTIILASIREALYQFEKRGAERHGMSYDHSPEFAEVAPICKKCGHTVCDHE